MSNSNLRDAAQMTNSTPETTYQQRGITGLETAIILIAFVVVASVFAFTVLSTGIFASERSKETVYSGLEEAKSTLEPRGNVIAYKGRAGTSATDDSIYKISFVLANAIAGEPVDLTPPYTSDDSGSDPDISSGAEYKTIISYQDINQYLSDVPWTVKILGQSAADSLLERGEKAEITVWLLRRDTAVTNATDNNGTAKYTAADVNGASGILTAGSLLNVNDQFTLQIKPSTGAVLTIQRIVPSRLDTIMDLQ